MSWWLWLITCRTPSHSCTTWHCRQEWHWSTGTATLLFLHKLHTVAASHHVSPLDCSCSDDQDLQKEIFRESVGKLEQNFIENYVVSLTKGHLGQQCQEKWDHDDYLWRCWSCCCWCCWLLSVSDDTGGECWDHWWDEMMLCPHVVGPSHSSHTQSWSIGASSDSGSGIIGELLRLTRDTLLLGH